MSEEEIKEVIERLECFEPDDLVECAMYRDCLTKIQGLLDLYKQEKEKNIRLTKDNLDLDRLYRKAGSHLIDIGKTELGEYLLAQIGAVPTWSDFDDYCNWIDKNEIRKIIYPSPENPIELEIQNSKMYKKLKKLIEE